MKPGAIVQIIDENHAWWPALLIVDEVRSWGVCAYTIIPQRNDQPKSTSIAPIRLETGSFEVVGDARIVEFGLGLS
jgi:hypothetical protein